jgi:4-aminobutyrate aminotransferase
MVDDEVQAGVGRKGRWFAMEHFDVVPDVVAIAKPIASGLPLGITVAWEELMEWPGGSHASTYGANPLACAAAHAVLGEIEGRRLMDNALMQGDYIMMRSEEMKEEFEVIGDVRGWA